MKPMASFVVLDADGEVVRSGVCQPHMVKSQAGVGETSKSLPFGSLPPQIPATAPRPMAGSDRAMAYPRIADQLDALWHAMDTGEIPKATKFYGDIKAVKDAYPK